MAIYRLGRVAAALAANAPPRAEKERQGDSYLVFISPGWRPARTLTHTHTHIHTHTHTHTDPHTHTHRDTHTHTGRLSLSLSLLPPENPRLISYLSGFLLIQQNVCVLQFTVPKFVAPQKVVQILKVWANTGKDILKSS